MIAGVVVVVAGVCLGQRSHWTTGTEPQSTVFTERTPNEVALAGGCQAMAQWVRRQLGEDSPMVISGPLVIGGDLPAGELEAWRRQTIDPAVRAMMSAYFATTPTEPIVILLFATEASYREHAARIFGDRDVSRYGYYRPHLRTIVASAECGPDALVHEPSRVSCRLMNDSYFQYSPSDAPRFPSPRSMAFEPLTAPTSSSPKGAARWVSVSG